jgi:hypothetical protein
MTTEIVKAISASLNGDPARINFVVEYIKDFDARRAAVMSGFDPDDGFTLRKSPDIVSALLIIMQMRLEAHMITPDWVLMEAVDNHRLARINNNLTASNAALNLIAKHAKVDAFAAEKVEVASDTAIRDRLVRARQREQQRLDDRMKEILSGDDTTVTFL